MYLLACSGPGAPAAISRSILTGHAHAAVLAGLILMAMVVPWLLGGPRRRPMPLYLLLLFHPAWTVSVIHGDCGYLRRDASWVVTVLGCGLAAWHIARTVRSKLPAVPDPVSGVEPGPLAPEPPPTPPPSRSDRVLSAFICTVVWACAAVAVLLPSHSVLMFAIIALGVLTVLAAVMVALWWAVGPLTGPRPPDRGDPV